MLDPLSIPFAATGFWPPSTPIYLASVLAIGIAAQWLAWKLRIPAIVLLLVLGFALGRVAPPDKHIAENILFPLVSLAVAVILFEGGLSLRLREIRETGGVVLALVTVGLAFTGLATFAVAKWILQFSTPMAAICGALLTVSGPTVVGPLMRHVRPHRRIGAITKWEGIVNDPIGAILAALVFEVVASGLHEGVAGGPVVAILKTLAFGAALGAVAAVLILVLFRRYLVPDYLQNSVVLAIVVLVYAISNQLEHESGLLAVTVLGVILANQRKVSMRHVVEFKENLRVLFISVLFIVLAARVNIDPKLLKSLGWSWGEAWRGVAFLAALVLVIRPIAVLLATFFGRLALNEKIFLAWIHPRGIVAAAVASLFALELAARAKSQGVSQELANEAEQLVLITFFVIVGTVTIYGLTLAPLARWLGLASRNPQGVLFAGASRAVREIAAALQAEGIATTVVDTNSQNIASARMAGIRTCLANIASDYAREEIDLNDLGRLLAMTPNDQVNAIAAMEYVEHFGRANVYQLAPPEAKTERKETTPSDRRGRILFSKRTTYEQLASRIGRGEIVKCTRLTEDFTYESFKKRYGADVLPLFLINESGVLKVLTADESFSPTAGQKVVALVKDEKPPGE